MKTGAVSCVICGRPVPLPGFAITCSAGCHEQFVADCERKFGRYKKVVSVETGLAYKVPTREIIERGLKFSDLPNYPPWDGDGGEP